MLDNINPVIADLIYSLLPFFAISLGGFFAWLNARECRDFVPDRLEFDDDKKSTTK